MVDSLKQTVVPINGRGQIDWPGAVRTYWPIILLIVTAIWYSAGRLESPERKQDRIDRAIAPLHRELDEMKADIKDIRRRLGWAAANTSEPIQ